MVPLPSRCVGIPGAAAAAGAGAALRGGGGGRAPPAGPQPAQAGRNHCGEEKEGGRVEEPKRRPHPREGEGRAGHKGSPSVSPPLGTARRERAAAAGQGAAPRLRGSEHGQGLLEPVWRFVVFFKKNTKNAS